MNFRDSAIPGLRLIEFEDHGDQRGSFSRLYCRDEFKKNGVRDEFVQANRSYTEKAGTIRGLHFQKPPHAEIKVVRCVMGRVHDVVVDLRKASRTFLKWFSIELSAESRRGLYIPAGFAHGFETMVDACEMIYFHSKPYTPSHESGIRYNDPLVRIEWPLPVAAISKKDRELPSLRPGFTGYQP